MAANQRKVVARYLDGRLVKGYTFDFGPAQPRFHVFAQPSPAGQSTLVLLSELKALFFVRDFAGDPARQDGKAVRPGEAGRHVEVRFRDGEVMVGTVDGATTEDPGFFLVPADPGSNNLRVYVVAVATRAVYPLPAMARAAAGSRPAGDGRPRPATPGAPLLPTRFLSWLTR
jgi:hypothetical protein